MSYPDLPLQENHEWKHFRQKSRITSLKKEKNVSHILMIIVRNIAL